MRLRARDHDTSSTLIGGKGKGGASPSSLYTTLEGPTEYVDAWWMQSLHGIPTLHQMDHVSWSLGPFSKTTTRMASHYTWGSMTTLHDVWRCVGTAAFGHSLSFGLSQFHGHGSWPVCVVALSISPPNTRTEEGKQENGRTVRLCPLLWKITIVVVHFAHANPWLFIIPITKPFLNFVDFLLKCGSRTEATHLSPKIF